MDAHRAFAGPTDTASRRPVTLQDGPAVDKAALCPAGFRHGLRQFFQTRANDFVVVIAPRIAGDAPGLRGRRQIVVEVIRGQNHHRAHSRQDALRIAALLGRALHPFHGGLASVLQPRLERLGMGGATGAGEPAKGKALLAGQGAQFFFGHGRRSRTVEWEEASCLLRKACSKAGWRRTP